MPADSGLYFLLRKLLGVKTKQEGEAFVAEYVGDEYVKIAGELLNRLSFKRTLSQNNLLYTWFREIAKHYGDCQPSDVKGQCHHRWALPIRLQDEKFAWVWNQTGAKLNYEKQCALLAAEILAVSSGMTTRELGQYMDEIEQHYRKEGVRLTHPEKEAA